jgi:hypothetical protein
MSKGSCSAGKKLIYLHDMKKKGREKAKEKADTKARPQRSVLLES